MGILKIDTYTYHYTLQRQRRKTVQIELTEADTLWIKAPLDIDLKEILHILQGKARWLQQKNTLLKQQSDAGQTLQSGRLFLFKGKEFPLQATVSLCKPVVKIADQRLCVNLHQTQSATALTGLLLAWYKQQAVQELTKRTLFWCSKLGTSVNKITVKDQKTRWGSCSSLGNINYNWRIIMAPERTIDYLVIHEVSHRIFLDHSAAFWHLVEKHSPDYATHKQWLKENGSKLFNIL